MVGEGVSDIICVGQGSVDVMVEASNEHASSPAPQSPIARHVSSDFIYGALFSHFNHARLYKLCYIVCSNHHRTG
jgi:hypothetical protein